MKAAPWLLTACCCFPTLTAAAEPTPPATPSHDPAGAASTPAPRPETIRKGDPHFDALVELARRGLVPGYKDAQFLKGQALSRFEAATLIKRIVDGLLKVAETPAAQPLDPEAPGTAAARGLGVEPPPLGRSVQPTGLGGATGYRESDLATVRLLADQYSAELGLIGVKVDEAQQRITALESRLEAVEKTVRDPDGPLQKALKDVARLEKVTFRGYVQARYESFQHTREGDPPGPRVPVTDRFTLRRMRLTVQGRPNQHVAMKWELEGGGGSLESRDAFVSYFLEGNPAKGYSVHVGQQKVPFGFEIAQSSGQREAPERARPIRFFYPSERDRGIRVSSPTGDRWFYEVALYNGVVGPGTPGINTNDNNNDKDVFGRIRTTQLRDTLDLGASFHFGNSLRTSLFSGETPRPGGPPSAEHPYENTRMTLGADFQWHPRKGTELRGEAVWGKAKGTYATGYILQVLHDLHPKYQLVARYDWLGIQELVAAPVGGGGTPVGDSVPYAGTMSNLALGLIHRLDPSVRLKLFYEINDLGQKRLETGKVPWQGNILRFEVLTLF